MIVEKHESGIWRPSSKNDMRPREQRRACYIVARITFSGRESRAFINNLSIGGVGLMLDSMAKLHASEIVRLTSAELGELDCVVRWCSHPKYGLQFKSDGQRLAAVKSYYDSLPAPSE